MGAPPSGEIRGGGLHFFCPTLEVLRYDTRKRSVFDIFPRWHRFSLNITHTHALSLLSFHGVFLSHVALSSLLCHVSLSSCSVIVPSCNFFPLFIFVDCSSRRKGGTQKPHPLVIAASLANSILNTSMSSMAAGLRLTTFKMPSNVSPSTQSSLMSGFSLARLSRRICCGTRER